MVKLFWHSIESDPQQKSFERMSRRQDSHWISVMVDDVLPLEPGHILQVETITRRRPIEFERICEPMKVELAGVPQVPGARSAVRESRNFSQT